jgi:hypothetical protein
MLYSRTLFHRRDGGCFLAPREADCLSNFLQNPRALLLWRSQPLLDAPSVFLIHLIEPPKHVPLDIMAALTQGVADIRDQVGALVFSEDGPEEDANLLELIRRMDEFIPAHQTINLLGGWRISHVCLRTNVEGIEIVCDSLLLIFHYIHLPILNEIVHPEWAIDGDLLMIRAQSVELCILI